MKLKYIIIIVLVLLISVLTLQNLEKTIIHLFFWKLSISFAFLGFIFFAIGVAIGFILTKILKK